MPAVTNFYKLSQIEILCGVQVQCRKSETLNNTERAQYDLENDENMRSSAAVLTQGGREGDEEN